MSNTVFERVELEFDGRDVAALRAAPAADAMKMLERRALQVCTDPGPLNAAERRIARDCARELAETAAARLLRPAAPAPALLR